MTRGLLSLAGLTTVLAMALVLWISPGPLRAQDPSGGVTGWILHYRWYKDGTIRLVEKKEIRARLKPSRSSAHRKAAGNPAGIDRTRRPSGMTGGENVLSYALFSAAGDTLEEVAIPDPARLRVEIQEKGESQLRSHSVERDSGDIFLRIAEPEARSIRFFKWHPLAPKGSLPKAAASKTLIAEFSLP